MKKLTTFLLVMLISVMSVAASDIKTQVVELTIPANNDTITTSGFDSVDPDSTIVLISGNTQHARGYTSTSNQAPDDTSTLIELDSGSIIRATRSASPSTSTTVTVLLIEYIGSNGGDNEFIVRDRSVNDWSSGTTSDSYTSTNTIADPNDVVVFNMGTENPNTGNNQYDRGDVRAYVDNQTVELRRGDGNGAIRSGHQVVEFTGANWNIQTGTATPARHVPASGPEVGGTDVAISSVVVNDSWVYFTWDTTLANLDERGHRVWLTNSTNLRVQEHAAASGTKNIEWYIIENENLNVQTDADDDQFSSSTSESLTGFTAVSNLSSSFAWVTGMTNGGGNAHPRDMWQAELVSTSTIDIDRSRSGQNFDYRYFVVELEETTAVDLMPTANADATPTAGQEPLEVTFNGTGTGGDAPLSYFWDFGDGSNSTSEDPVHTYTSAGSYNATLTVTDNDGDQDSDVVTITVTADTAPVVNPSAIPTSGQEPLDVDFTGGVTGGEEPLTYFWDFDDGSNSTSQNPSHTFTSAGTYNVSFTAFDSDDDSDTGYVVITVSADTQPIANASADPTSGLEDLEVDFTGSATGGEAPITYFWDFGDGSNSSSQNPTHTYTTPGVYNATLTVTDNDLDQDSDVVVITVTEDLTPTASASANPTSGVEPLEVDFDGTGTGGNAPLTYFWDFGDGSNSTSEDPTHTYTSAGSYNATLTVTDNDGDFDTDVVTITVDADLTPTANADATPTSGQEPLEVTFNGTGSGGNAPLSYFWDFGDGSNSTSEDPVHTYTSAGSYNATLTVTDNDNDQDSDVVVITVTADTQPIANASADVTEGDYDLNVSFTGGVTSGESPYTYFWDFGDGSNSTSQNPTHTYTSAGVFTATFTVTDNDNDEDSDSVVINVTEPATSQPDLIITNLSFNEYEPVANLTFVNVTAIVKNDGDASAGSTTTRFFGLSNRDVFTVSLAPGASTTVNTVYLCTSAHNASAEADILDDESESNEGNNGIANQYVDCVV